MWALVWAWPGCLSGSETALLEFTETKYKNLPTHITGAQYILRGFNLAFNCASITNTARPPSPFFPTAKDTFSNEAINEIQDILYQFWRLALIRHSQARSEQSVSASTPGQTWIRNGALLVGC